MNQHPDTTPPPRRPATLTWMAAALAVAIIAAALVVSWRIASLPAPATPETPQATSTQDDQGQCPAGPVEMAGTVTVAPEATWSLVGKVVAPTVPEAGPATIDPDGYRRCYARTPLGALTAAANLAAMGSDPALAGRLADDGLMPGALRDRLLSTPEPSSATAGGAQIRGFQMVSYDGTATTINLGMQAQNGGYGVATIELVWHEGDWRIGVRGEGEAQEMAVTYSWPPSLVGFVLWAGI